MAQNCLKALRSRTEELIIIVDFLAVEYKQTFTRATTYGLYVRQASILCQR